MTVLAATPIEAEAIATGAAVGHSVAPARHASVQHAGNRARLSSVNATTQSVSAIAMRKPR